MTERTVHAAASTAAWTPDLSGRTALITGEDGLGLAMAAAFAAAGADVAIASRKYDLRDCGHRDRRGLAGRRVVPYACHVGHWQEVGDLGERVWDDFGKVDVLVNDAGISPLHDSLAGVTEELFDKVIDVNLKGPMKLSIALGTRMADHGQRVDHQHRKHRVHRPTRRRDRLRCREGRADRHVGGARRSARAGRPRQRANGGTVCDRRRPRRGRRRRST